MDGGFTDNLVLLDEHTMTVSPFCGESDICPRDGESSNAFHVSLFSLLLRFFFLNPNITFMNSL